MGLFCVCMKNYDTKRIIYVHFMKDKNEKELRKLKREELLKIMLAQGEEIDHLKERIAELEKRLSDRELKFEKVGSLAEASLLATNYFREAEKAAELYLENIKRMADQHAERLDESFNNNTYKKEKNEE